MGGFPKSHIKQIFGKKLFSGTWNGIEWELEDVHWFWQLRHHC